MNDDSDSNFVPRAPRFEVNETGEVVVDITRAAAGDGELLSGELVDVSQHGVKLRVPIHLQFEESLQLKIEVSGRDLEYHGVASVRHIRAVDEKNGEESWVVGCAIAPPFSDETFAYLATSAGKERRRFRRLPIAAEATIRRQTQTEGTSALLHNLSSGGFCFLSEVQYEVGESVRVAIEDTEGKQRVIEARICWQVDSPDGSIAGCQFTSQSSYSELCACLTEQPVHDTSSSRDAEPTSKLVLTAAVLAMFVPPMMTLMLQANKVSAKASLEPSVSEPVGKSSEEVASQPVTPEPIKIAPKPQLRTWVDNTGKHRTLAELVEVTPKYLVLLKANGRKSKVPWRRLSEADQAFAQAWQGE